jgi:hypothetical protein
MGLLSLFLQHKREQEQALRDQQLYELEKQKLQQQAEYQKGMLGTQASDLAERQRQFNINQQNTTTGEQNAASAYQILQQTHNAPKTDTLSNPLTNDLYGNQPSGIPTYNTQGIGALSSENMGQIYSMLPKMQNAMTGSTATMAEDRTRSQSASHNYDMADALFPNQKALAESALNQQLGIQNDPQRQHYAMEAARAQQYHALYGKPVGANEFVPGFGEAPSIQGATPNNQPIVLPNPKDPEHPLVFPNPHGGNFKPGGYNMMQVNPDTMLYGTPHTQPSSPSSSNIIRTELGAEVHGISEKNKSAAFGGGMTHAMDEYNDGRDNNNANDKSNKSSNNVQPNISTEGPRPSPPERSFLDDLYGRLHESIFPSATQPPVMLPPSGKGKSWKRTGATTVPKPNNIISDKNLKY